MVKLYHMPPKRSREQSAVQPLPVESKRSVPTNFLSLRLRTILAYMQQERMQQERRQNSTRFSKKDHCTKSIDPEEDMYYETSHDYRNHTLITVFGFTPQFKLVHPGLVNHHQPVYPQPIVPQPVYSRPNVPQAGLSTTERSTTGLFAPDRSSTIFEYNRP